MSRYDYRDPGQDPEYCNPLTPEPDDAEEAKEDKLPQGIDCRVETCGRQEEGTHGARAARSTEDR